MDFKNGAGIPKLTRFQEHFHEYKIVVYSGLNCERMMYKGHVESDKCINLLFGEVTRHYHAIGNLTGAMAKRCVCECCNKGCIYGAEHTKEQNVVTVFYVLSVYLRGLEFRVTYATDMLR